MGFAEDVRKFRSKAAKQADQVCRAIALGLLTRIVMRSPVGNPELWAINAKAQYLRETHNLYAERINAEINANPENFTPSGRLRRGVKRVRRMSKRKLAETYKFRAGKNYVGGRFRGNWTVSIGAPSTTATDDIDPQGKQTIEKGSSALAGFTPGLPIYIMNSLPYAVRLEYEGWSKQAPAGMVRVSVAEFQQVVGEAVQSIKTVARAKTPSS